jgi:hypothetical protein
MATIDSHISAASKIAKGLVKRNTDVATATNKRDVCLYKFFKAILKLDDQLRNMGKPEEVRRALKLPYRAKLHSHRNSAILAIKLTYPSLAPKACSKYAAALSFVRRKKKPGQSVRDFMQAHGGINGCVSKEKKSRPPKHALGKLQKK